MADGGSSGSGAQVGGFIAPAPTLPKLPLGGSPIALVQALDARITTQLWLDVDDRIVTGVLVAYRYKPDTESHLSFDTWLGYVSDMVSALAEEAGPEALARAYEKAKYKR